MSVNLALERLYDRIELVAGVGDPGLGRLCIMSFVAYLAGEPHGDNPASASPLLRAYAIAINDAMDAGTRQRLKPFAPRVLGTNDGLDKAREDVIRNFLRDEALPEIAKDLAARRESGAGHLRAFLSRMGLFRLGESEGKVFDGAPTVLSLERLVDRVARMYCVFDSAAIATAAARVLITGAQLAPSPSRAAFYWSMAIDLLDRLCAVGIEDRRERLDPERVMRLASLGRRQVPAG